MNQYHLSYLKGNGVKRYRGYRSSLREATQREVRSYLLRGNTLKAARELKEFPMIFGSEEDHPGTPRAGKTRNFH
jgi:hypothetical protein